ncbi:hypothetical protein D3C81_1363250 [compost metagenome]
MRCAKRPLSPWQRLCRVMQQTGYRDAFQCLSFGQRGQQAIQTAGQHGFPGSRWADQQQVVTPGRGDLQRPFSLFLAQDILQVGRFLRALHCRRRAGYR